MHFPKIHMHFLVRAEILANIYEKKNWCTRVSGRTGTRSIVAFRDRSFKRVLRKNGRKLSENLRKTPRGFPLISLGRTIACGTRAPGSPGYWTTGCLLPSFDRI